MLIREDDLDGPEIAELLRLHLDNAARLSPPESVHALDLDALRRPDITVWTAWDGPQILGCGALKQLDPRHGEVKSMHTAAHRRGMGVGSGILTAIVRAARQRRYDRLSLETGSNAPFVPARALYARFGFRVCGPFGPYHPDPHSTFMTLDLGPGR